MSAQSLGQFEKNVSVSFGYVKKDLLMVNDSVSELHDKIQHLSLNQAMLLEKIAELEKIASGGKKQIESNKELKFYDLKTKTKFSTSKYTIKKIKNRKFAVAVSPSGNNAYRILSSAKKTKVNKEKTKKVLKKNSKVNRKTPKKVVTETVLYE